MRRLSIGLISLVSILLAACQTVEDIEEGVLVDRFQAGQSGRVSFPTRDVKGVGDLYNGAKDYNARTLGELFLPARQGPGQTFCAMVIVHGSGGAWNGRGKRHAAFLVENGIAAFVVDTYEGRGLIKRMPYLKRMTQANLPDQIADAFAALDLLSSHPNIDAECIGVMGYSMGGMSTFLAADEEVARAASRTARRFALHVSFYAPCSFRTENVNTTGAPILALWGEKDESTDRADCDAFVRDLEKGASPVTTHWLAGAAHGWNDLKPISYNRTMPRGAPCQFVLRRGGILVERLTGRRANTDVAVVGALRKCSAQGYSVGRHEQADRQANRLLLDFIRRKRM